jgi:regulator of protease activity HflC (stomatin/prohibitin superfamily)
MTRQMSAERTRRAVVTEADGAKQASITVAEGNKQSAILNAEGDKQAAILRSEGFALALEKIYEAARGVDANTMSLQYLEALKQLGASASTKFIIPMEFANLAQGIAGLTSRSFSNGNGHGGGSTGDVPRGDAEPAAVTSETAPPPPPAAEDTSS